MCSSNIKTKITDEITDRSPNFDSLLLTWLKIIWIKKLWIINNKQTSCRFLPLCRRLKSSSGPLTPPAGLNDTTQRYQQTKQNKSSLCKIMESRLEAVGPFIYYIAFFFITFFVKKNFFFSKFFKFNFNSINFFIKISHSIFFWKVFHAIFFIRHCRNFQEKKIAIVQKSISIFRNSQIFVIKNKK